MRTVAFALLAVAGCGDNLPTREEPSPDCSAYAWPTSGWTLDGAREAIRRTEQRERLRVREAVEPGYVLRETALAADEERCPQRLAEVGRVLFEHTFSTSMSFQRVPTEGGDPETTSCLSCHWQRGAGGSGGLPDAVFVLGDGDSVSSGDARNPPSLAGAGVLEALAAEMTAGLAKLRDDAVARAKHDDKALTVDLVTKGVSFGSLAVDATGHVDTSSVRGVDPDLVVRPFGAKGSEATLVDMIASEASAHLGATNGLAESQLDAIAVYLAALDVPAIRTHETPVDRTDPLGPIQPYLVDEWAQGRTVFETTGCASCHVSRLPLARPTLTIGSASLDLAVDGEPPRIERDPLTGDYPIFLFSDLKRHDLGDANASQHLQGGVGRRFYVTRPLWGAGVSAPYMHDGTSMTIDAAVARHGGEAAAARDAFTGLSELDRSALRIFVASLRRGQRMVVP